MTRRPGDTPRGGLLLAGLIAGMLFFFSQKSMPVTAQESLSDERPQTGLAETTLRLGKKTYRLEVAATPEQEEKGLMFRTRLAAGHGMLFSFDPPRPVTFWMKNTKIPLDMVFLHQGRVVNVQHSAMPCLEDPCPTYPSVYVVDSVVELPAGTAEKDAIRPGEKAVICKPEEGR